MRNKRRLYTATELTSRTQILALAVCVEVEEIAKGEGKKRSKGRTMEKTNI